MRQLTLNLCLATALLLLTAGAASGSTAMGKAGDAVTDLCLEAEYLSALAHKLRQQLKSKTVTTKQLRQSTQFHRLAANSAAGGAKATEHTALALWYDKQAAEASTSEQVAATAVENFETAAHRQAGKLIGLFLATSMEIKTPSGASPTLVDPVISAKLKTAPTSLLQCGKPKLDGQTSGGDDLEIDTIYKLPLTPESATKQIYSTVTIKAKACSTSPHTTCNSGGNVLASPQTVDNAIVLHGNCASKALCLEEVKLNTPKQAKREGGAIGKSSEALSECDDGVATDSEAHPTEKQIAKLFCLAREGLKTAPAAISNPSGTTLASQEDFRQIANSLLIGGKRLNLKDNTEKETLITAIKATFSEAANDFQNKFVKAVEGEEIVYGQGDNAAKGKIKSLAGTPQGDVALSYSQGQHMAQQLVAKSKKEPTEQQPKICKGNTATECNSEKCEFKEGKCVAKEGAKVEETGAINTSTTGSNSFVIHKAPLWLAVFAFTIQL